MQLPELLTYASSLRPNQDEQVDKDVVAKEITEAEVFLPTATNDNTHIQSMFFIYLDSIAIFIRRCQLSRRLHILEHSLNYLNCPVVVP